jgi:hypothetical protein
MLSDFYPSRSTDELRMWHSLLDDQVSSGQSPASLALDPKSCPEKHLAHLAAQGESLI